MSRGLSWGLSCSIWPLLLSVLMMNRNEPPEPPTTNRDCTTPYERVIERIRVRHAVQGPKPNQTHEARTACRCRGLWSFALCNSQLPITVLPFAIGARRGLLQVRSAGILSPCRHLCECQCRCIPANFVLAREAQVSPKYAAASCITTTNGIERCFSARCRGRCFRRPLKPPQSSASGLAHRKACRVSKNTAATVRNWPPGDAGVSASSLI
ncbi:hypothetical protein V8C26DRAFT_387812 [Trichoderma gracile]